MNHSLTTTAASSAIPHDDGRRIQALHCIAFVGLSLAALCLASCASTSVRHASGSGASKPDFRIKKTCVVFVTSGHRSNVPKSLTKQQLRDQTVGSMRDVSAGLFKGGLAPVGAAADPSGMGSLIAAAITFPVWGSGMAGSLLAVPAGYLSGFAAEQADPNAIATVEGAAQRADPGGWIAENFQVAARTKGAVIVKSQRVEAQPRSVLDDPADYPELQNQGAPYVIEVILDGAGLIRNGKRFSMQCRLRARVIDGKTGETCFKSFFTTTGKKRLSLEKWAESNPEHFFDSLRSDCRDATQGLVETLF